MTLSIQLYRLRQAYGLPLSDRLYYRLCLSFFVFTVFHCLLLRYTSAACLTGRCITDYQQAEHRLLKLGDVLREVVDHKFRILQDDIGDESVLGRLYLQLLLRLRPSNNTRSNE